MHQKLYPLILGWAPLLCGCAAGLPALPGALATAAAPAVAGAPTIDARFCPAAGIAVDTLRALDPAPSPLQAALDIAAPVVAAVCAGTTGLSSLRSLNASILPVLQQSVLLADLPMEKKNGAILALGAARVVLADILAAQDSARAATDGAQP